VLDFLRFALLVRRLFVGRVGAGARTSAVRALGDFLRLVIATTVAVARTVDMLVTATLAVFLFEFGAFGVGVPTLAGRYRITNHFKSPGPRRCFSDRAPIYRVRVCDPLDLRATCALSFVDQRA